MHTKYQEEFVFGIILVFVFVFQLISATAIVFAIQRSEIGYLLGFAAFNLLIFCGMIKYAQWLWKRTGTKEAVKRILKWEGIFLAVLTVLVLLAKFARGQV